MRTTVLYHRTWLDRHRARQLAASNRVVAVLCLVFVTWSMREVLAGMLRRERPSGSIMGGVEKRREVHPDLEKFDPRIVEIIENEVHSRLCR